jgi:hypothetical protein
MTNVTRHTREDTRNTVEPHLNSEHRDTVEKIFAHPTSANMEWRQVVSLLEAIATVSVRQNGELKVTLGSHTEFVTEPHGKDIGIDTVVALRRLLRQAGFAGR